MKALFLIALTGMVYMMNHINHMNEVKLLNVTVPQEHIIKDSLFEDNGEDGNWEYMNEFKLIYSPEEKTCLKENIFFEAATESDEGKKAVGIVTLNRVKSKKFPNTICEVVKQAKLNSNGVPLRNQCQFSWYCDGKSDKIDLTNPIVRRTWNNIDKIIDELIKSKKFNTVGKSTYYHSTRVKPWWSKKFEVKSQIGSHIFYTALP